MVHDTRKFDGKTYQFRAGTSHKGVMKREKAYWKDHGYSVRITKEKSGKMALWVFKKKRRF